MACSFAARGSSTPSHYVPLRFEDISVKICICLETWRRRWIIGSSSLTGMGLIEPPSWHASLHVKIKVVIAFHKKEDHSSM